MLRPYTITSWVPTDDHPDGVFGERECLIDDAELERLREVKTPRFLVIYVDDMKKLMVPVDCIDQILESEYK